MVDNESPLYDDEMNIPGSAMVLMMLFPHIWGPGDTPVDPLWRLGSPPATHLSHFPNHVLRTNVVEALLTDWTGRADPTIRGRPEVERACSALQDTWSFVKAHISTVSVAAVRIPALADIEPGVLALAALRVKAVHELTG